MRLTLLSVTTSEPSLTQMRLQERVTYLQNHMRTCTVAMMSEGISFFSTGMARSGTNLVSKILSANSKLHCVIGANIELYRFTRDQLIQNITFDQEELIPRGSAFSDFFGRPGYFPIVEHLFAQEFEVEFESNQQELLRAKSLLRDPHDSPDVKPILSRIKEKNSVKYLESLAKSIRTSRRISKDTKLGFHESWHIEMLPALQKSFPHAKFIIILKDVRGSYSSHKFDTINKLEWRAHIFNYARQFRKYSALADYFSRTLSNCKVYKYEDLMSFPAATVMDMCDFLGVDYEPQMLDSSNHIDPFSQKAWTGNSGYGSKVAGFDKNRSMRWKAKLQKNEVTGLELMCHLGLQKNSYLVERIHGMSLDYASETLHSLMDRNEGELNRWDGVRRSRDSFVLEELNYWEVIIKTTRPKLDQILRDWFSLDYFCMH